MNGKRLCLRLVPLLLPPAALLLFCALRQNGVYTLFPYADFLLLAAVQGFGCRGGFSGFGRQYAVLCGIQAALTAATAAGVILSGTTAPGVAYLLYTAVLLFLSRLLFYGQTDHLRERLFPKLLAAGGYLVLQNAAVLWRLGTISWVPYTHGPALTVWMLLLLTALAAAVSFAALCDTARRAALKLAVLYAIALLSLIPGSGGGLIMITPGPWLAAVCLLLPAGGAFWAFEKR